MRARVAEAWVEAPLQRFVDDARVQFALLLHPSGQVLGQFGFTRAVDVMAACALGAAIHASAGALGKELDGHPFRELRDALQQAAPPAVESGPALDGNFESDLNRSLAVLFGRAQQPAAGPAKSSSPSA